MGSLLILAASGFLENPEDETRDKEKKASGWLGVSIQDVTSKIAKQKKLKTRDGAYITEVLEDSPAESAGLERGDVIVEFGGKAVLDAEELTEAVRKTAPGTKTNVVAIRNAERKTFHLTTGKMPRSRAFAFRAPRIHAPIIRMFRGGHSLGLTLHELKPQLGEYFGVPEGEGILVEEVKSKGAGEKAGFKAGDVILKIGKRAVNDMNDVWRALDSYEDEAKVDVEIFRKGSRKTLSVELEEEESHFDGAAWFHVFPRQRGMQGFRFEAPDFEITVPDAPRIRIEKELNGLRKLE